MGLTISFQRQDLQAEILPPDIEVGVGAGVAFGEQVADDGMRLTDENPVQLWIHGFMPCLTASRHHFTQTVQADDYRIRIDMLPRPSALSRAGQSSKNSQSGQFRSLSLLQFS